LFPRIFERSPVTHSRFEITQDECVGCGLCEERAPANLRIPPGQTAAIVVKQPADDAEAAACHEAADFCPMGALHALEPDVAAPPSARHRKD